MAGKLLEQQGRLGPRAETEPHLLSLDRQLMGHLQDLKADHMGSRTDLVSNVGGGTPYCRALETWLHLLDPNLNNTSLKEHPLGCTAEVDGRKIIITGSVHTFNAPPAPLEDFSLLACSIKDRSTCAFENDPREGS
jgi:hypothetical protein